MADDPSEVKAQSAGVDGGLNLKGDPQRLAPPAVTRADNVWHLQSGNVQQLPGFNSYSLDSVPPATYSHVYNLSMRDTAPPAPAGDVMLHAEVNDIFVSGMTRSMWLFNTARSQNYYLSQLPFTMRIRPIAGSFGLSPNVAADSSSAPNLYTQGYTFAREEGTPARRRCMMGRVVNGYFIPYFAYVEGLSRVTGDVTLGGPWTTYDAMGLLNDARCAVIGSTGSQTDLYMCQFNGTGQSSVTIATAQNSSSPMFQLFNHAGRSYLGYPGVSTTYLPSFRDIVAGTTATLPTQGSTLPAAFAVHSPYTHQTKSDTTYFAMVQHRSLFVVARATGGTFAIVGGPVTLPTPSPVPSGTINYAATVVTSINDSQGGVGPSARLNVTVFGHFPERVSGAVVGQTNNIAYQSVFAATYRFTAAVTAPATTAGTLAQQGSTRIFRTPAGAALISKAFTTNPSEAAFAGPVNARQALVVVQSGATEPDYDMLYNGPYSPSYILGRDAQPTYFIINHLCEVVGRYLENAATPKPSLFVGTGLMTDATNLARFPNVGTLSNPLFSDGSVNDDCSALTISIPTWGVVDSKPVIITTDNANVVYENRALFRYTAQPVVATLALAQTAAGPPTVSAGPHTYFVGPVAQMHDGYTLVEQNYHFGAHNMLVVPTFSSTSDTGKRYTNFYLVYSWFDSEGRKHRSQPSLATTVFASTSQALNYVTCYVPCPISAKDREGSPIVAEIYASLENNTDDTAYFVGSDVVPSIGYSSGGGVPYTSIICYAVSSNEAKKRAPMYTSPNRFSAGRTFTSATPRCFYYQVAGKGRCFALGQISGNQRLYYSSVASDVLPFEWNPLNYAPIPPDIGDARSLEIIDDKIVVLGTRGNAVMSGDGPLGGNSAGAPSPNDGFSPVTPVPTPAGVVGTGSPARIPEGIVFQGYSGIQLLGRDLSVSPIGAEVDALTGRQVGVQGTVYGRAVTLPALQSVVFPSPRGPALVYSYLTKKWSTWPLLPGASVLAQRMDGSVWATLQPYSGNQMLAYGTSGPGADMGFLSAASYLPTLPASGPAGLIVETPWINIGGVTGGEADLWDMEIVGTWFGPHTLQVEQAYNYSGSYTLVQTADMSTAPTSYQTRWRPLENSRMWAVRYRVSLLPLTTLQAGYPMAELSDLVVYSQALTGTTRTPDARTR